MSNNEEMKKKAFQRFDELWKDEGRDTKVLDYGPGHKYVVFSDLHLGDGSGADNFRQNEKVFLKALDHYESNGFSLILLGDVEEYHQFSLDRILKTYFTGNAEKPSVYDKFKRFDGRIHRVYGNHDIEWALRDPLFEDHKRLAVEAIVLKKGDSKDIMLTHGHQAVESYEKDINIVRFGTVFYREMERIFKFPSKSIFDEKVSKKDKIYDEWAAQHSRILICGHTHCPIFATRFIDYRWVLSKHAEYEQQLAAIEESGNREEIEKLKTLLEWLRPKKLFYDNRLARTKGRGMRKSPSRSLSNHYFNTGACLLKDIISNIEIEGDTIRLVYWHNKIMEREILFTELDIPSLIATGV
jgi:UDP-2,3-diacylglucosamine pyrophosphatase LpxH